MGGVGMMIITFTFIHIDILSTYYTRERLALCSSVYFLADSPMVYDAGVYAEGSSTCGPEVRLQYWTREPKSGEGAEEEEENSEVLHLVVVVGLKRGSQVMLVLLVL